MEEKGSQRSLYSHVVAVKLLLFHGFNSSSLVCNPCLFLSLFTQFSYAVFGVQQFF